MSGIDDLVAYHLKVEPIVVKYININEETKQKSEMYMVRSIKRPNQSYTVVYEHEYWVCDCPSYKYKSGTDTQGNCKHIRFIIFLLAEHVEIEVIE